MTTIFIGTADDALGFRLCGTTAFIAKDAAAVERAITDALANVAQPILIFSRYAASLAHDRIAEWQRGKSSPLYAVLPD